MRIIGAILLIVALIALSAYVWPGWAKTTPTPAAPTPTPTASEPAPAVPAAGLYKTLTYDAWNGDCHNKSNDPSDPLVVGQETYVAYWLCQAIDGKTETAMHVAVSHIQEDAKATGATTIVGPNVTLPSDVAWVVWCVDTTSVKAPNDVAFPLGLNAATAIPYDSPNGVGNVFFVPKHGAGTTGRTFTGCPTPPGFWAVAVH